MSTSKTTDSVTCKAFCGVRVIFKSPMAVVLSFGKSTTHSSRQKKESIISRSVEFPAVVLAKCETSHKHRLFLYCIVHLVCSAVH